MTKEEILALAESIDANGGGCMFANYDGLEAFIQALVESREGLREAVTGAHDHSPGAIYGNCKACIALANDDARMSELGKR